VQGILDLKMTFLSLRGKAPDLKRRSIREEGKKEKKNRKKERGTTKRNLSSKGKGRGDFLKGVVGLAWSGQRK